MHDLFSDEDRHPRHLLFSRAIDYSQWGIPFTSPDPAAVLFWEKDIP